MEHDREAAKSFRALSRCRLIRILICYLFASELCLLLFKKDLWDAFSSLLNSHFIRKTARQIKICLAWKMNTHYTYIDTCLRHNHRELTKLPKQLLSEKKVYIYIQKEIPFNRSPGCTQFLWKFPFILLSCTRTYIFMLFIYGKNMSKSIVSFGTLLNISTSICYHFHMHWHQSRGYVCRCLLHVHIEKEKKFDHKANSCHECLKPCMLA